MANPYWIHEDCFIFKPYFNGSIIYYLDVIKLYSKLIFSDYNDFESSLQKINKNYHTPSKYISSEFNIPLTNSLDQLINLTLINFGDNFNQLPRKFLQNFLELHKINISLFY